jgi:parallel beta-helix repeat protein
VLVLVVAMIAVLDLGFNITTYVKGPTINVPTDYPTIQEGIDAANDGDTIIVSSGVYYEHVIINKSITLMGEEKSTTIIDGGGFGDVVTVISNNVSISEFTIRNSGDKYYYVYPNTDMGDAGIQLDSHNNMISNNLFKFNHWPIYFNYSYSNKVIENDFKYNKILLWSAYSQVNIIQNNNAVLNGEGLYFYYSNNNIIEGNYVSNNNNSGSGIHLVQSSNNKVVNNKVLNSWQGIYLQSSSNNNNITQNNASFNKYGIRLSQSQNNKVTGNTAYQNKVMGFLLVNSAGNRIFHNNILQNGNQSGDIPDINYWDNGYPSAGNYWSDYIGVDIFNGPFQNITGSDGIGDTAYVIDADSKDNYPLMEPFSIEPQYDTFYLYPGWNLISINNFDFNTQISSAFDSILDDYDAVQVYVKSDTNDSWKHYHILKPDYLNDLKEINNTDGIFIHITNENGALLVINRLQLVANQFITLSKGWNLVGYPSNTNLNRIQGLNNLEFGRDLNAIQWFDASTKSWHFMGENDSFEVGRGYWIHSKVNTNWEVPL